VFLLEIHTAGFIEYEAYHQTKELKDAVQIDPMIDFEDILANILVQPDKFKLQGVLQYETNCKYPLVFHLPNYKRAGRFFGESDYTVPVIAKVYAINQNYNQIQYVLRKHAHPKMIVPKEVIKQAIKQVTTDNDDAKKREGNEVTYKRKKGFQPLHISWGSFLVDVMFRKGSAHSNHGTDYIDRVCSIVKLIRTRYSPDVPILICGDSGFADQKAYQVFEQKSL
jgi:hypothetical protein